MQSNSKPQAPCRNCSDRVLGCHGTCIQYNDYVIANKKHNEDIRKSLMQANIIKASDFSGTSPPPGRHRKTRGQTR